jgi:hypothetical protein
MRASVVIFSLILVLTWPFLALGEEVVWKAESENCKTMYVNGVEHRTIFHNGLFVAFSGWLDNKGKWFRAQLYFANYTNQSLNVHPEKFTLEVMAPEHRSVTAEPPDQAIRKLAHLSPWQAALLGFKLGTQQASTSTHGTFTASDSKGGLASGSYEESTSNPSAVSETIKALEAKRTITLSQNILRTNSLLPGIKLGGDVYFKDVKKATSLFVVIPVADVTFKFAYLVQSKAK